MREAHARTPRADEDPRVDGRPALRVVEPGGEAAAAAAPATPRRTIRITGQPVPARRSQRAGTTITSRPDRVALWAVLMGVFLVFMAAATAKAGDEGGARYDNYQYETLGNRTLKRGDAGSDVKTLQLLLGRRGFEVAESDGRFGADTQRQVRRFQRSQRRTADGRVGPATREALAEGWRSHRATWYGPGFYGNKTACGQRLHRKSWGVAHRSLPCGTRVPIKFGTRIVIAPVIDRGPYAHGANWDLTERVARALHMAETSRVRTGR
jgi:rare lipoprotein A (peptidoglycan hydrolase)